MNLPSATNYPRVLGGIVTRDRADIVSRSIASLQKQQNVDLTIAVIDDGSSDSTPQLAGQFPDIEWVRRSNPQGYVAARNEFMGRAGYKYFVSLDDDAWFLRDDEVATAVSYLETNPQVAAVAFDILSPDHSECVARAEPKEVALFIGCGHVLRLPAVQQLGGYEPNPGSYGGEEKDLCLRLLDAGYSIVKLPGVHVWHDKTTIARDIPEQHRAGVCNDLVMTYRRTPAALLVVALLAKVWKHLLFSMRSGLTRSCLKGFLLFIRSLPKVASSRRPVRRETLNLFLRLAKP